MSIRRYTVGLIAVLLLATIGEAVAGQLYRYRDENGELVVNSVLPPTAAQRGYDILSDTSMRLLERVAPRLTPEQLVERERLQQVAEAEAEVKRKQLARDRTLLATYTTLGDLNKAREVKIEAVRAGMAVSELSLVNAQKTLSARIERAAEYERDGKSVPPPVKKNITKTRDSIVRHENNLVRGRAQIEDIRSEFAAQIARFKELKGLVDEPAIEAEATEITL